MLVSLFTDASVCPINSIAGWGCWAKSKRGVCTRSKVLKFKTCNPNLAELAAIVNGLSYSLFKGVSKDGDTILIQSDSKTAIAFAEGEYTSKWINNLSDHDKQLTLKCLDLLKHYSAKHSIILEFRWIKGHRTGKPRNWVNGLCDKLAKSAMRTARDNLNKI